MPDLPDESALFHEGVELFNAGEWFEAHETWEDIWHLASGAKRNFYQGLIQVAVTMEHVRRGNPRGVRSVYQSMRTKFVGLPEVYMGVDICKLIADLDRVVQPVLSMPSEAFDPALPRGQELPVDWSLAPRIVLVKED